MTAKPNGGAILQGRGVAKTYGPTRAVRDVDLDVQAGRIVGLVGNNGAGKTTLIKMLVGILAPDAGTVLLGGQPTTSAPTRAALGFLPEDSPLYEDQTPLGYLAFFARLYGMPAKPAAARAEDLLRHLRLDEVHWRKPIGNLSKGSARKVAIARAFLHDPQVLVLDEPASGLDPATRAELDHFLHAQRAAGKAILLSAHNLGQVEALCDDILLMADGRIVAHGTLAQLRATWGTHRYRLAATTPFPGSAPAGPLHAATLEGLDRAERAMATVRAAGGQVVNLESVPPGLDEILRLASGAAPSGSRA